jgi:NADPH:quinone reductase-like Zn-dependent oxidoreductase
MKREEWVLALCTISTCSISSVTFACQAFATGAVLRQRNGHLSLNSSPHAWIIPEGISFGSLEKLEFQEFQPDSDEAGGNDEDLVQVSTRAIGLNFADIFCVLGLYAAANTIRGGAAFCPGLEFSGVVSEDSTRTFQKGDRVLGFRRFGAYADAVSVPPCFLFPLPSNWTFLEGASFLVQALTAWHGLVEICQMPIWIDKEKTFVVLVHSAAGGVGLWASELAARRGGVVIGVVGSQEKAKVFNDRILPLSPRSRTMVRGEEKTFAKRLAHTLCVVHETDNHNEKNQLQSLRESGNGVNVVMESLGGRYFSDSFESLNSGGAMVTFGSTSYVSPGLGLGPLRLAWRYLTRPKLDPGTLTARNIRLAGFNLIYLTERREDLRRELCACIACLSGSTASAADNELTPHLSGVTPPVIGNVFDFRTEAIAAMECLKSGKTVGKVVLDNSNNPNS